MRLLMIYGESVSFGELVNDLKGLNERIKHSWKKQGNSGKGKKPDPRG